MHVSHVWQCDTRGSIRKNHTNLGNIQCLTSKVSNLCCPHLLEVMASSRWLLVDFHKLNPSWDWSDKSSRTWYDITSLSMFLNDSSPTHQILKVVQLLKKCPWLCSHMVGKPTPCSLEVSTKTIWIIGLCSSHSSKLNKPTLVGSSLSNSILSILSPYLSSFLTWTRIVDKVLHERLPCLRQRQDNVDVILIVRIQYHGTTCDEYQWMLKDSWHWSFWNLQSWWQN